MVFSRGRCLQMSALAGCSILVGDHLFAYEQPAAVSSIQPGATTLARAEELRSLLRRLARAPITNLNRYPEDESDPEITHIAQIQ
jgi:hypothetical protein